MASLDILRFNPFNLKYFMPHQYMPKIFRSPHKSPPPPHHLSYIFNVRYLMETKLRHLEILLSWKCLLEFIYMKMSCRYLEISYRDNTIPRQS